MVRKLRARDKSSPGRFQKRTIAEVDDVSLKYKKLAAARALEYVEPDMKLGLGTGSTAAAFIDLLGEKVAGGLKVICVPTSEATRAQAERLRIPLTTLDDEPILDLAIDGADEIDPQLRLIKGGGGAHLREKIVAMASDRFIVIAEGGKRVKKLGKFPLPIEVVQFGLKATLRMIEDAAADTGSKGAFTMRLKKDGSLYITDNGNLIVDAGFGEIPDPEDLAEVLEMIPGVVEHGLFIGIADEVIVAGPNGVEVLTSGDD
ncbi:MAG: ribose-5-phosphate isomerase RpiA [Hyphomicrobiales bacterium]|nr:ribose-5-phosphate isomerase RpiA [Hyphomicrobiales bacterium]